jgi:hypothetical protein
MKFAVKQATCLGCKTPLKKGSRSAFLSPFLSFSSVLTLLSPDQAVCDNCRGRTAELHSRQVRSTFSSFPLTSFRASLDRSLLRSAGQPRRLCRNRLRSSLDAMSALSGVASPSTFPFSALLFLLLSVD